MKQYRNKFYYYLQLFLLFCLITIQYNCDCWCEGWVLDIYCICITIFFLPNTNTRQTPSSIFLHLSRLSLFLLVVLALFTRGSINKRHLCGVALNPRTPSVPLQQEWAKAHKHAPHHTYAALTSIIIPPPLVFSLLARGARCLNEPHHQLFSLLVSASYKSMTKLMNKPHQPFLLTSFHSFA